MEAGPRDASQQSPHGDPEPLTTDGPDGDGPLHEPGAPALDDPGEPVSEESFSELRPPRRLRVWQIAPIVGLAILGSLMFAFPLAFEFGDGGAVVAMLGLLLSGCAAGWGLMAARRVGYTWPGLPPRGSGRRPDWRFVLLYIGIVALLAALTFWRVARLR
ncbi:hypothetical protein [Streptomyces coffeae]|uniref:Transmembrane protein n=1 Tax=Streptomyces coffeae TaxID=621382 RepID=A0ABS1NKX8_9ACTN|nr:hypothetical protein [Streptomyces coffeae]MBL1100421.1 hypothetical protein [Streptomyces coffeae]